MAGVYGAGLFHRTHCSAVSLNKIPKSFLMSVNAIRAYREKSCYTTSEHSLFIVLFLFLFFSHFFHEASSLSRGVHAD